MRDKRQVRSTLQRFETRDNTSSGEMYISGYFSVFNSPYKIWDGAEEIVSPGAFTDSLQDDIRCLIDHDTKLVLGRTKAGTLTLKQDKKGLWGEVKINPNDQDAVNFYERVKRGDIDQCSFGFDILDEEFIDKGDNCCQWLIKKVKLYEVSIVTFPAYEETSVSARKQDYKEVKKRSVDAWKNKIYSILNK